MNRRSPLRRHSVAGLSAAAVAVALNATPPDDRSSHPAVIHVAHPAGTLEPTGPSTRNGFQGTVAQPPTTLSFPFERGETVVGHRTMGEGAPVTSPSATGVSFQRYDVAVDAAGSSITWAGRIDPARAVSLLAWNGSAWELLDSTRGRVDHPVGLAGAVRPRHLHGGVVPVMVTGTDPFADDIPNDVRPSFEDPDSYDFSLAHVTDTQYLSEGAEGSPTPYERATWRRAYTDTTEWIVAHADRRKIAFTAHTGDVMQNWQHPGSDRARAAREFEIGSAAQRILDDAGLVNSVLPGNHDNLSGTDNGPGALFNDHFGPERYRALEQHPRWRAAQATYRPWRRGDNANSYVLFSAAGLDFIAVSLGFTVTPEEMRWADEVLGRYADRNAILLTHAYTSASTARDGRGGGDSFDGRRVRAGVVARNPNVFLVLSGHEHGVNIGVRRDVGRPGNHVVELLADYQFYEVRAREVGLARTHAPDTLLRMGSSFFRLLQFDVDRSEMSVDTYSPFLDDFGATEYDRRRRYDGTEDDFRLPVQLQHRATSFATASLVLSGPSEAATAAELRPRGR